MIASVPIESAAAVTEAAMLIAFSVVFAANTIRNVRRSVTFFCCTCHSVVAALIATPHCASAICLQTVLKVFTRSSPSRGLSGGFAASSASKALIALWISPRDLFSASNAAAATFCRTSLSLATAFASSGGAFAMTTRASIGGTTRCFTARPFAKSTCAISRSAMELPPRSRTPRCPRARAIRSMAYRDCRAEESR
ncbi:MAG: hypothetical protein FJ091_10005 [Deltaproteobacteria bacterium]|nr:hypothetical protein [Deltaproteobacteria bacterium]